MLSEAQTRKLLQRAAEALDEYFNPDGEKRIGFALLIYNLDGRPEIGTRVNYVGNGSHADVHQALKELVAQWDERG